MRVVVVGSWAPSLITFRGHLLAEMVQRGHEVHAVASDDDQRVASELSDIGVRYHWVPLQRTGMNPIRDLGSLNALRRLFGDLAPDLVLTYTAKPVIYGGLAAYLAGVPRRFALITGLGYTFMGQDSLRRRALNRLVRALYRASLRRATGVLFQNPDDRALFCDLGLVKQSTPTSLVAGSGVDIELYQAPAPEPPERAITFLLIARLLREKGVCEYVEAARAVRSRHPQARFQLLGPLDQHPNSISRADLDRWQQEGVIEYLDETADVRPYIKDCDVYVLPSYREGTPRSVLEAMAMSRPIITTDVPGCRETVVPGQNGVLVAAKSWRSLATACETFIDAPSQVPTMGAKSRHLAEQRFDVRRVNDSILSALGVDGTTLAHSDGPALEVVS